MEAEARATLPEMQQPFTFTSSQQYRQQGHSQPQEQRGTEAEQPTHAQDEAAFATFEQLMNAPRAPTDPLQQPTREQRRAAEQGTTKGQTRRRAPPQPEQ